MTDDDGRLCALVRMTIAVREAPAVVSAAALRALHVPAIPSCCPTPGTPAAPGWSPRRGSRRWPRPRAASRTRSATPTARTRPSTRCSPSWRASPARSTSRSPPTWRAATASRPTSSPSGCVAAGAVGLNLEDTDHPGRTGAQGRRGPRGLPRRPSRRPATSSSTPASTSTCAARARTEDAAGARPPLPRRGRRLRLSDRHRRRARHRRLHRARRAGQRPAAPRAPSPARLAELGVARISLGEACTPTRWRPSAPASPSSRRAVSRRGRRS